MREGVKEAKHAYLPLRGYFALSNASDVWHMMTNRWHRLRGPSSVRLPVIKPMVRRDGDEERPVGGVSMWQWQ